MATVGPYRLRTVDAGTLKLDGGGMFGRIPKPLWERRIPSDARNRITLAMRCLLLEGNGHTVLVDTGLGRTYSEKFADIYGVDQESAELQRSLEALGVGAEEITDVILTHLHFDHCGGCTAGTGEEAEVVFPAATFHVQRRQWEWALDPKVLDRASFLEDNLRPLEEAGRLNLLEGTTELLPGVELPVVNGHTRGQQLVKVSGPERTLLYGADLFPTRAHLAPRWNMAFDVAPIETFREKSMFLDRAVEESWDLFFEHDPRVEVATLDRAEGDHAATNVRSLDALH